MHVPKITNEVKRVHRFYSHGLYLQQEQNCNWIQIDKFSSVYQIVFQEPGLISFLFQLLVVSARQPTAELLPLEESVVVGDLGFVFPAAAGRRGPFSYSGRRWSGAPLQRGTQGSAPARPGTIGVKRQPLRAASGRGRGDTAVAAAGGAGSASALSCRVWGSRRANPGWARHLRRDQKEGLPPKAVSGLLGLWSRSLVHQPARCFPSSPRVVLCAKASNSPV